jgi:hypothetical protein
MILRHVRPLGEEGDVGIGSAAERLALAARAAATDADAVDAVRRLLELSLLS